MKPSDRIRELVDVESDRTDYEGFLRDGPVRGYEALLKARAIIRYLDEQAKAKEKETAEQAKMQLNKTDSWPVWAES